MIGKNRTLVQSFQNAFNGLKYAYKKERNLRIQTLFGIIMLFFAYLSSFNHYEWILLIFSIMFIIVAELFNTSIEYLIDLKIKGYSKKAKKSKDIAAAAVLVVSFVSFIVIISLFIRNIL